MSLLVAALLAQSSRKPSAFPDLLSQNVPFIEFDHSDVRLAFAQMLDPLGVTYFVDPVIEGLVTVDLRNVALEVALTNVARQVEANLMVVPAGYVFIPRADAGPTKTAEEEKHLEGAYKEIDGNYVRLVATAKSGNVGSGGLLARDFSCSSGGDEPVTGAPARRLLDVALARATGYRERGRFSVAEEGSPSTTVTEYVVEIDAAYKEGRLFRDVWVLQAGVWRLQARSTVFPALVDKPRRRTATPTLDGVKRPTTDGLG